MAGRVSPWLLLPRPVRELPADLVAVVALVVLTDVAVLAPVVSGTPLRVVLGLPLALFLPGYALVAALFPEAGGPADDAGRRDGIDGVERVALSFGLSIAVVPLLGLGLNFTPWGIRLVPIVATVSGATLAATAVAAWRRDALPPEERFAVPYAAWVEAARAELLSPPTRTDAALNVLLAASVVLAVASVAYAVAVPKPGEAFTEFYLLTERDDGELVAADYPTEFVVGEAQPVVVGIGNHERRDVSYTVVVVLQRVAFAGNETAVREEVELGRLRAEVAHNETWQTEYVVRPTMTGERLRLAFLLYDGPVPAAPGVESAYRETHLWVNVSESA